MRAEEMISMGRGGHASSGPPPDPNALRNDRSDVLGWKVLPITGRPGDPPEWPLTVASARELKFWTELWRKPQATEWERLGQVVDVALYVRRLVEVEQPGATASLGNHVLRLAEGLGLTLPGLLRLRWQIGGGQPMPEASQATGPERAPARRSTTSPKGRLSVVRDDGA